MGRPPGLRLRVRGPDRDAVAAARGLRRSCRRDRLAAVRAGAGRVRLARAHVRRSCPAGRRTGSRSCPRATATTPTPALAHLERALFEDVAPPAPPSEGAIRFLEGAGTRATLELVADELLQLLRAGTPAEEILVVCPSLERLRAPLEAAFGALGVPYALDGAAAHRPRRPSVTRSPLSCASPGSGAGRRELFGFVRSPYSGLQRAHADFLEGRLRGRGDPLARARRGRGAQAARAAACRSSSGSAAAPSSLAAVRELAASMLRAAHGLGNPPATEPARLDLRAHQAVAVARRRARRLARARRRAERPTSSSVRSSARPSASGRRGEGHVAVARSAARAHPARRGRLRARARGGRAAAAHAALAVPRRRAPSRARRPRAAREGRPRLAGALPLLHGVHAAVAAAVPRARGGDRRRRAAPAEPLLGGRPGGSRP